ncbi:hypothetical protein CDV36_013387 [Fusarium kuroshium]|uniref:Uncharacterized protein n=1 Tax=Fusarium kuroshium TaxID=2010991 RepID=A0A3M2RP33_9HYPO|nr:hypothetical protein CDV36_013387 [Fusarium kuroshium]
MTTKGNVVRANGSRLRALFNPTSLRLRQDQEKAERAAEVLSNKVFVAGQLKHYGIKFPRTAKLGFIRDILRRAVEQGKCDQVPPFVRRVEEVLRRDIAPLDEEWETKAQVWQEDRFATAGKRAQHDINRFLDLYFFTNGNPDPTKTPAPLALYGYRDIHTIYVEAGRVPCLSLISGGSGKNQVLCVGWDSFAVRKLAETIGETNRKDEDHQRDNDREHDTDYQLCGPAPDQNLANASQPLDLEWLFGSYVIQFEGITEDWHMTDVFTLDIGELNDGVLMAAYDFGDVWGTMILSQSEEKLDLWAMLNDNPRQTLAKARQRLPKRYGIIPSAPRRLFYKIRGRERGEDVIFYFPQRGHIDILDDECTKLSGMAERLAHMGSNLQFWGHKVADEPNKHIQGWGEFSEKQYEFERRDRWRRR